MALEGGEESVSCPGRSLPPGKTQYPLYRRLGEPQGRSGQVRKISPPPGFDPWTVQPVASRYTDYATRPTFLRVASKNFVGRAPKIVWLTLKLKWIYNFLLNFSLSGFMKIFSAVVTLIQLGRWTDCCRTVNTPRITVTHVPCVCAI